MKSRAAVLRGVGVDWEVTDIELDPPRAGEVLVKMAFAGICHSDEHFYTGDSVPSKDMEDLMRASGMRVPEWFPMLGGHEGSGVVEEVGPGVTSLKPGDHVAISFGQARKRTRHGIYASLTPMRFQGGSLTTHRRGVPYTVQRLFGKSGQEMLYILTFYLPRFMDVDLNEKLVTILHELWHISPDFDGDLRRHPGRCYVHSRSQAEYDAQMQVLADRWLQSDPPQEIYDFLRGSFAELHRRHGRIYGTRVPHPKLLRVSESELQRSAARRPPTTSPSG